MSADGEGAVRIASLAMYRDPPPVAEATRAFWTLLRDRLRGSGLPDVPDALDEIVPHDEAWLRPRLLLAQTCGYPFARRLRGRVRLIATPLYAHPGCAGAMSGSFVIVRRDAAANTPADLRGRTAAINDPDSNSGMNLLRHYVAPHALNGRFFGSVVRSGSHLASIAAVAAGQADVAAVDCVTYGNLARFAPERLHGVRILAETARTPGLPLITSGATRDDEVTAIREALFATARDPAAARPCDTLGLRGFEILPAHAYDAALAIEREAAALGYPHLDADRVPPV